MRNLTPEQIAKETDHLSGLANIRAINRIYRSQDGSHLWPISGRFNVTERAIRKARKIQQETGTVYGLEYAYMIDALISEIVNSQC